ncbi:MAG: hypothetical protein P8X90_18065, partial [Desulfobacterales bacterium]
MINEISRILQIFRSCFSRHASFEWFAIVIIGFIVRIDHYGVSSFVRWLGIKPARYTSLLAFFRASSWQLKDIMQRWWQIVLSTCPLIEIDGRLLLAGDGIKISKEAEK